MVMNMNNNDLNMMSGAGAMLEKSMQGKDLSDMSDKIDSFKLGLVAEEMEANKGWKNSENKKVQATGFTVIFTKYERNPYRAYIKSNNLIMPDFETNEYFKSMETGEMERAELGVICCHAVSVGPECKYIKEGDDIYIRNVGLAPVPFAGRGYWAISEQNVICKVVDK